MITPRVLKGFRDFLPNVMIPKKTLITKLEAIFELFGFAPIDTPTLEYTEILLGKGGGETDKQIYRFNDHGGRDISLRFDLTVPLARFVSQHFSKLSFPFKAYHIAPVWRGENTQKGRYREFYQCDFDILGTKAKESDLEILLVIRKGLESLNAGDFRININNRKIINAILSKLNIRDKSVQVLRAIDKIYKIGIENVIKELNDTANISETESLKVLELLQLTDDTNKYHETTNDDIFALIEKFKAELGDEYQAEIDEIEFIFTSLQQMGYLNDFAFNPAITRGLDYYTGVIFESFILDRRNFGSICSGGRYDNLTGIYSKNVVPGVGASFGLDRIIALLEDKKLLHNAPTKTDLLIFNLDNRLFIQYQQLAEQLRDKGVNTEVYFEKKKIQAQFKNAENKSIHYVLFAGEDDFKNQTFNIKNIKTGNEENNIAIDEIIKIIKQA